MKMRKIFHKPLMLNKCSLIQNLSIYHWIKMRSIKLEINKYRKNYIIQLKTKICKYFQTIIQKIDIKNILNKSKLKEI